MDEPTSDPIQETAEPDGPIAGWSGPPPDSRRLGPRKILVLVSFMALAVYGVAFTYNFATVFLDNVTASNTLTVVYGPPYGNAPADFRSRIGIRLRRVAPADFDEYTVNERVAWVDAQTAGGLGRLDDATLTRRYRLMASAVGAMSAADCVSTARAMTNGGSAPPGPSDAFWAALSDDRRMDWIEIDLQALEANVDGVTAPREVTADDMSLIVDELISLATPAELNALGVFADAVDDETLSDVLLCGTGAVVQRLPAGEFTTVARYVHQP